MPSSCLAGGIREVDYSPAPRVQPNQYSSGSISPTALRNPRAPASPPCSSRTFGVPAISAVCPGMSFDELGRDTAVERIDAAALHLVAAHGKTSDRVPDPDVRRAGRPPAPRGQDAGHLSGRQRACVRGETAAASDLADLVPPARLWPARPLLEQADRHEGEQDAEEAPALPGAPPLPRAVGLIAASSVPGTARWGPVGGHARRQPQAQPLSAP